MQEIIQCRFPEWKIKAMEALAKKHKITISDLLRASVSLLILTNELKLNRSEVEELAFKARVKLSKKKI
jgi:hypothetical protein